MSAQQLSFKKPTLISPSRGTLLASPRNRGEVGGGYLCNYLRPGVPAILEEYPFLESHLAYPDAQVRTEILAALHRCAYQTTNGNRPAIISQLNFETEQATKMLVALVDFQAQPNGNKTGYSLLADGFKRQIQLARQRVFWLLSFIYPATIIMQAKYNLDLGVAEKRAYALEVLDLTLSANLKRLLFPFFEANSPHEQLQQFSKIFPQSPQTVTERLHALLNNPSNCWMQACAIYTVGQIEPPDPVLLETPLLLLAEETVDPLILETAQSALITHLNAINHGERTMLTTIEKTLILKTVSLFKSTPNEVLAEIATLLEEIELLAGETVFSKGDPGDCMYIIVSGKVKAHDGETIFNTLGDGDVFGEMAVLDPEPRLASITVLEDVHLLRLHQQPFYELMEDRIEVARGIIHVLSNHLRNRVQDVAELTKQLSRTKKIC